MLNVYCFLFSISLVLQNIFKYIHMDTQKRIKAFIELGKTLNNRKKYQNTSTKSNLLKALDKLEDCILEEQHSNPWFIPAFIEESIKGIIKMLDPNSLNAWLNKYPLQEKKHFHRIGVIMAGNIPMVGFHDFLCVLLAGDIFIGKLSSNDKHLLPALADVLCQIEGEFKDYIHFTEDKLPAIDKIIATGSNNSARYFNYYFSKYPCIIRKHCNSLALLDGTESEMELKALINDMTLYFGLGCRSVSKLYVPPDYDFCTLFRILDDFKSIYESHHTYLNNLEYQKTIHLLNKIPFYDAGIMLFKEHTSAASSISVIHYEFYKDADKLWDDLTQHQDEIQCLLSNRIQVNDTLRLGQSQYPEVWEYANNIDTLSFLLL